MAGEEEPTGDAPPAEAPAEEAMQGEAMEPPPAPKKKPKFFVHWNRRKPRFYDYNWDYGDNYYSNLVKYMDTRTGIMRGTPISDFPRRMAFAERGIRSNVARRATPDVRTSNLLDDVRKSIKNFELSQRSYMKRPRDPAPTLQGKGGPASRAAAPAPGTRTPPGATTTTTTTTTTATAPRMACFQS